MIPADPAPIATAPAPSPLAATDSARALIQGQLAILSRLAQIGMEIAEACGREAREGTLPSPEPRRDPGLAFARVARAVRMTIALQSRLAGDLAALDRADDLAAKTRHDKRRMRLSRLVAQAAREGVEARRAAADAAEAWARSDDEDAVEDEIEQLSCEAYERLVDAEDGDLAGRPFDEVVAGICADLGLSPDWTARIRCATAAGGAPVATSPIPIGMAGLIGEEPIMGPSAVEPMVEGTGPSDTGHHRPAPSTTRSSAGGAPPPQLRSG